VNVQTDIFRRQFVILPNGCWQWIGNKHLSTGYGRMWLDGQVQYAHRISYLWHVGDIPEGLVIHHICQNRLCVNPEHLEAIDNGFHVGRHSSTKKLCKRGEHEMSGENLGHLKSGRYCKACNRERVRRQTKI
jgi:hypothetical protein